MLFGIARDLLPRMMLPVGDFSKPQIRAMAEDLSLQVAGKPDSQEICFVASGRHAEFVGRRLSERSAETTDRSGQIVTIGGEVVGQHPGIEHFTVGQRKGLRVAMGEPYYVVAIDAPLRRVTIGPRSALACTALTATGANWLVEPPADTFDCEVQIRYRAAAVPATVQLDGDHAFRVRFAARCEGVAPGQAAVCYRGRRVLGGGWIAATA